MRARCCAGGAGLSVSLNGDSTLTDNGDGTYLVQWRMNRTAINVQGTL
jgi:hypothetical protein